MEFRRMRRVGGYGEGLLGRGFNMYRALRSDSLWCVEGKCLEQMKQEAREARKVGRGLILRAMYDLYTNLNLILRKV